jgi:SAM-dependent methyltransferase
MPFSLTEVATFLCCPDDAGVLSACAGGLRCQICHRLFPLLSANILDILPLRPVTFPERSELAPYREGYLREFFRPAEIRSEARAWGSPEAGSRKSSRLRERQASEVLQFLQAEPSARDMVFCDLSAGAGYCTFRAAQEYRLVFHCDLSMDALAYAGAKARTGHLENMIFVHADYFQPPFRSSVDHLTCLDTLIRGPWHEKKLLQSIQSVLASDGTAVVDFHNWWHNPLRRMGFLPDNFVGNKSYTRKELRRLLLTSGIGRFETRPFVQELDPRRGTGKVFARFLSPTRWMVRIAGTSSSLSQAESAGQQRGRP